MCIIYVYMYIFYIYKGWKNFHTFLRPLKPLPVLGFKAGIFTLSYTR